MPTPPHGAPDWDAIDTVCLDLDGTLLDLAFDNYVWLGRIPEVYAEARGLAVTEARAEILPKLQYWQHRLEWYDVHFWSREFALDVVHVHREAAGRVGWLPGARGFLERVRERGKRLVLLTNSHPDIVEIKHERTGVLDYFDTWFTSQSFKAPKEDPRFWEGTRAAAPYDPARSLFADDSRVVLHAAIGAGMRWVYAVRHADSSRDPHEHEEFSSVHGVAELL